MSMETIFDHVVTPDEVVAIKGLAMTKKEYLDLVTHADTAYSDLYSLFIIRENPNKAQEYFNKIESSGLRAAIIEVNEGTF